MSDPSPLIFSAREKAIDTLLAARNPHGHWSGQLSQSALATATAVCALALVVRNSSPPPVQLPVLIRAGAAWLAAHQNPDGGWGDTDRSVSNISTTTLVWAAFGAVESCGFSQGTTWKAVIDSAENWLRAGAGSLEPDCLAHAIASRYGKDRTFSVPILTMCALSGRLGTGRQAWKTIPQLPFELAALPAAFFGALRLPVVSYALPALIAMGQVRHHFHPTDNRLLRWLRTATRQKTLETLTRIQPPNGGFLEATPLTAFVTMSLAAMGLCEHPVVTRGVEFLVHSAQPNGGWAIDSNLATWLTTLSIQSLGGIDGELPPEFAPCIRTWLLQQQYRKVHLYTNAAPGGWAWTDLPGGVPDADDTAGALLALRRLGPADADTLQSVTAGVQWLLNLQNGDGGLPTFCKGWGALPFDRSSPDITAHGLRAWAEWLGELPPPLATKVKGAIGRGIRFLAKAQRSDGSWIPLWFGHEKSPEDENPLYGTARVLLALEHLNAPGRWPQTASLITAARKWLLTHQQFDGGWAGAREANSSMEETALALEALTACNLPDQAEEAVLRGATWLATRIESGDWEAAPIGLYFAKLWYYERLYPLIFATAALRSVVKVL